MRLLRSWPVRLVILIVSLVAIVSLSGSIWDVWRRGGVLGERQNALAQAKRENEELKAKLKEAGTIEFIEREARNKLGMGKEGETIVIISNNQYPITNENQKQESVPNWKQWIALFL